MLLSSNDSSSLHQSGGSTGDAGSHMWVLERVTASSNDSAGGLKRGSDRDWGAFRG